MAPCLFSRNLCFSTFARNINYNIFQYIIKMKIFCYENPKKKKNFSFKYSHYGKNTPFKNGMTSYPSRKDPLITHTRRTFAKNTTAKTQSSIVPCALKNLYERKNIRWNSRDKQHASRPHRPVLRTMPCSSAKFPASGPEVNRTPPPPAPQDKPGHR